MGWRGEKTSCCYFLTSVGSNHFRNAVNVNKPATSVVDGVAAPKPPSQVTISGSGRVSISGSIGASGATLIPRPSRVRELVTMAEVDSGRLTSLGRVTYGRRIGLPRR